MNSQKGITDIIAVVLLLMITISLVGFAWIWLQRAAGSTMEATTTGLEAQQQTAGKIIRIDNVDVANNKTTIRNIGSYSINSNEVSVYKDGTVLTCTWSSTSVAPGALIVCTSDESLAGCSKIKVTAPGNTDEVSC